MEQQRLYFVRLLSYCYEAMASAQLNGYIDRAKMGSVYGEKWDMAMECARDEIDKALSDLKTESVSEQHNHEVPK